MTPLEKLLSRDGVQSHWISSEPIGRTMNGRHKIYSCLYSFVDMTPQSTGWTEVIDSAHVAKLEAALKVAVEALKNCEDEWCKHPDIRLQANEDLSRDFCGQCHSWVYRNEISTPTKALADIEKIAGGE